MGQAAGHKKSILAASCENGPQVARKANVRFYFNITRVLWQGAKKPKKDRNPWFQVTIQNRGTSNGCH
jgi:hypothetical protein